MKTKQEYIKEFQKIYEMKYGIIITDDLAAEGFEQLAAIFSVIYKPLITIDKVIK